MCVFTNLSSKVLADSKRLNRRVVCLRFVAPSRRQPDRYFSLSLFPFLTIHLVFFPSSIHSFSVRIIGRRERDVSIFRASFSRFISFEAPFFSSSFLSNREDSFWKRKMKKEGKVNRIIRSKLMRLINNNNNITIDSIPIGEIKDGNPSRSFRITSRR